MATTKFLKSTEVLLTMLAIALATSLSLALDGSKPAQAAFPGTNGNIVFDSYHWGSGGYWDIYMMNSEGTEQQQLTTNPAWDGDPVLSPDGTKIAFASNRTGNYEIYIMNADGTGEKQLTNNPAEDREPAFSPDGSEITFSRVVDNYYYAYNSDVYLMDTDPATNDATNLTNSPLGDDFPAFSPDGSKIAFRSCRDGNSEVYLMDTDPATNDATNLSKNPAWDGQPDFSPDGTKIAFASQLGGVATRCTQTDFTSSDIYVMSSNGTERRQLTTDLGQDSQPNFSPDGTKIAFWHEGAGDPHNDEVYVMDASGTGTPINLTKSDFWNEREPDWGPSADVSPPETTIDSGPTGTVNSDSATFGFSASEAHSTFECSLDNAPFTSCTSPESYAGLADGPHTFSVRATDAVGNVDQSPAERSFEVDTTKPAAPTVDLATESDSGSSSTDDITSDATPTLVGAAEANSGVELFADGASLGRATASGAGEWNLTVPDAGALPDGENHITAKATDAAGNASDASAELLVTVDTLGPRVEQVVPTEGTMGVPPTTDLVATFSEKMAASMLTGTTFKLLKVNGNGTTTLLTDVTVTCSADGLTATLNPYGNSDVELEKNTRYRAVVTLQAKDVAGNALDQDPSVAGNQRKVWVFKTSG